MWRHGDLRSFVPAGGREDDNTVTYVLLPQQEGVEGHFLIVQLTVEWPWEYAVDSSGAIGQGHPTRNYKSRVYVYLYLLEEISPPPPKIWSNMISLIHFL